jgi:hypothetical protein
VWGFAPLGINQYAVYGQGRVGFPGRSGFLTIAAGRSSVSTTMEGGPGVLGALSKVLATLQTNRAGVYIQAAVANPATGRITIYLNRRVTAATKVAYFILD